MLIPTIDFEVHKELHKNIIAVPVLGEVALNYVLQLYNPKYYNNSLSAIDGLLSCLDEISCQYIKKEKDELESVYTMMDAVDCQKDFIRKGVRAVSAKSIACNVALISNDPICELKLK